jgi:lysylphosphatidylglycerol synthetase-like protein (DUF2156 family)
VIPEAPFLFSIAGLSASLGGLSGLVAGLRRGTDMRAIDLYRLREIVEFSFANAVLALATIPLALMLGSTADGARLVAASAVVYMCFHFLLLFRRSRQLKVASGRASDVLVVLLFLATLGAAAWTVATGNIGVFEALLIMLLVRPMLAFLFVVASFETS